LFLVPGALRKLQPSLHEYWSKGGVQIITTGGYHFDTWSYDRADYAFGVWVIDSAKPKAARRTKGSRPAPALDLSLDLGDDGDSYQHLGLGAGGAFY
jgi:hypothetical protein